MADAAAALIEAGGGYTFSGAERKAWNQLSNDEKWAYLEFARDEHRREDARVAEAILARRRTVRRYPKHQYEIMRAWKSMAPEEREQRVAAARRDENRPDAMDIEIQFPGHAIPDSPRSVDEFNNPADNQALPWNNFDYEFVETLYRRNWRRGVAIGSTVRLYIGRDADGRIRDRVVVKTADYLDSVEPGEWHNAAVAYQVDLIRKNRDLLLNIPDNRHILKPRSFRVSIIDMTQLDEDGNPIMVDGPPGVDPIPGVMTRRGLRIYMDYCELGDLIDLMGNYFLEDRKVPEKFIWQTFKAIMEALYVLNHGRAWREEDGSDAGNDAAGEDGQGPAGEDGQGPAGEDVQEPAGEDVQEPAGEDVQEPAGEDVQEPAGEDVQEPAGEDGQNQAWRPRLHRDIKPANVFLRKTEWSDYEIVLADFDLMEFTDQARAEEAGSRGYIAPEHYTRNLEFDARADIYSLSAVLWDLMNTKRGWDDEEGAFELKIRLEEIARDPELNDPDFYDRKADDYPLLQYINQYILPRNDLPRYTTWLTDLVDRCCRFAPLERPLLGRVMVEAATGERNMETFTEREEDKIVLPKETFLIGRRYRLTRRRRDLQAGDGPG